MHTTTWRRTGEESDRGSVSSGQRGLYYAVNNMRRGVATGTITSARVVGQDQVAIYDSAAGVDLYPRCSWCDGAYCQDISGHYDRWSATARRPMYYEPESVASR